MPKPNTLFSRDQVDAVHRAWLQTQIATGALVGNHGMHDLSGTQNSVDWAGLNAFGASDTLRLSDPGDDGLFLHTVLGVEWLRFHVEEIGQRLNGLHSTRGTFVEGVPFCDCRGVGATAGIAALAALGLGSSALICSLMGLPSTLKRIAA